MLKSKHWDAVEAAYRQYATGVEIPIAAVKTIRDAGERAAENGEDVGEAVRAAVAEYRVKPAVSKN